jgi:ribonuclease-3
VEAELDRLEERLGYRFGQRALVERALTHASYANEHAPLPNQEALAFVGDAVLGLVVGEWVFRADDAAAVGVLTPQRAALVSGANLARWARDLDLGELLRLGRGEDQTGGRGRESILATTLEAVLGAVYLDGGLEEARRIIGRLAVW